ncbi:ABC transporter permease subunit [Desertimonas flava]|uniref:branched-chain amino acid ABC transporter ATP-binding protein/permease n=1 Tax=Desertimonas flava TaxID=2064846 RepID=UPI000E34D81D|nr:branched-chain amino acid ABC transporter ATP-binding protein/permease [Desertimonas flava]
MSDLLGRAATEPDAGAPIATATSSGDRSARTRPVWPLLIAALVAALVVPQLISSSYWAFVIAFATVIALNTMGLNLLYGYGGVVSLGHGALVGVGAYTTGVLMTRYDLSYWLAAPVAMVVTAAVGSIMALPSLRLSRWYFAIISLAFAEMLETLMVEMRGWTGGHAGLLGIPRPSLFGSRLDDQGVLALALVLLIVTYALVRNLVQSRIGIALVSARDVEVAARSNGVSPFATRFGVFMLSAAVAGLGGSLFAIQKSVLTPDDFTSALSIFMLIAVVIGGAGSLAGPVIGAAVFFLSPDVLSWLEEWRVIAFAVALLVLVVFAPDGLAGLIRRLVDRLAPRPDATATVVPAGTGGWKLGHARAAVSTGPVLSARGIGKSFDTLTVLDDVDFDVSPGEVVAIVGPNGSGKTTLLNCVSGVYTADRGSVTLGEIDVTGRSTHEIARAGLTRTFQQPQLTNSLSVQDNVRLGVHHLGRANLAELMLRLPRGSKDNREADGAAARALAELGLGHLAGLRPDDVPHGQQRLVEMARVAIGSSVAVLLDEPAAGLDESELREFSKLVRALTTAGIAVVLVEHHVQLVRDLADRVIVLDQGRVLAAGGPDEVFADPAVRRAYLGAESAS